LLALAISFGNNNSLFSCTCYLRVAVFSRAKCKLHYTVLLIRCRLVEQQVVCVA